MLTFMICGVVFNYLLFLKLFTKHSISFILLGNTFDINSSLWEVIAIVYFLSVIISYFSISYTLSKHLFKNFSPSTPAQHYENSKAHLFIGTDIESDTPIIIPEKGLYQNILITGTIGTGKTSSAMYPFTKQLLEKNIGMLILDVKGNFHTKVLEFTKLLNKKVTVIELNGKYTYNPLDKPNLKPAILANRLKTILTLFSNKNTSDSYWLDKVESYISECIKLCRLYNDKYVTFLELHKLINSPSYLEEKISYVKNLFLSGRLSDSEVFDFSTCIDFFRNEYAHLDSKVLSIIQSEITRITQIFVNDLDVSNTFCPPKDKNTFEGFHNLKDDIVVLNMNVAEYRNLAKIIASYLKLDFQSEVLMRLSKNTQTPVAFICDEYHEYATENDADFFSQSREAKCINIVSTQSYTSLLNCMNNQNAAKVIIQSLVNKIWFRTDDMFTIEEAQKQLGKEDKTKINRSISENAKETKYNYLLKTFKSDGSNLSESISTNVYHDYIYDFNTFSRDLKTFHAICFISTGFEILKPKVVKLSPISSIHKLI
ncbi:MAG: type IV secretion system DNA-binding domain-containing protein [Clostridia bacterium]|nr:type IV secretion system DNA-binding domain-containing protein [Clostridia bacterium]